MISVEPNIIFQKPFKETGLYKATVNYTSEDRELYGDRLKKEYIVKYLPLTHRSSSSIKLNPVLCETFINKTFKSPYLNTAEIVSLQSGIITLFFNEADGDFWHVRKRAFPVVKDWITSVVKGIAELHKKRIIHGDIKGSNIIIYENTAKLSDFGSSAIIIGDGDQVFNTKMYSPQYRAPEVWENNQWGLAADIWALGCTIYEMIYHQPLFKEQDSVEGYYNQLNAWANTLQTGNCELEISKEWNNPIYMEVNRLIVSMLYVDPRKRPNIFEILLDSFFEGSSFPSFSLSSSPSSICDYSVLSECASISQRVYNYDLFRNPELGKRIRKYLSVTDSDEELNLMVLSMYDDRQQDANLDKDLLRTIILICNLLTHRDIPVIFNITRDDLNSIIDFSEEVNFHYINWFRFYGVC